MFSFNPLAYLFGGSTLVLAIALGGITLSKNATIHEVRHSLTTVQQRADDLNKRLVTTQRNEAELQSRIDDQNTEVERLKLAGEIRQKSLDAIKKDDDALRRSKDILGRKGVTCEDADKLIMELVK